MKKTINALICLSSILLVFQSCKKDEKFEKSSLSANSVTIKEAKIQYQRAVKSGLPSKIKETKLIPDWDRVSRYKIAEDDHNLYINLGINPATKVMLQMVIRKKQGIINGYIVEAMPDLRKFNSERLDYSHLYGKMTFYNLVGEVKGIILLEDGKPVSKSYKSNNLMSKSGSPNPNLDSDGDGVTNGDDKCPDTPAGVMVDAEGCDLEIDLETVEISPGYTWPAFPPIGFGGFQFPPMDWGDGGDGGPGNPIEEPEIPVAPSYIINEVVDTCINKSVGNAMSTSQSMVGLIAKIIRDFDDSKTFQVKIKDGVTPNGKPGYCAAIVVNGSVVRVELTLQTSYFTGTDAASKESLVATLIHEVVHGYISKTDPNSLEVHHDVIAARYIDPMAQYLQIYFGLSSKDAYALSWSGVPDSKAFREAANETLFPLGSSGISISKSELSSRAGAFNGRTEYLEEGIKGQDICSN